MPNQMPTIIPMEFYTSLTCDQGLHPLFLNLPKSCHRATKSAAPNSPIFSIFFSKHLLCFFALNAPCCPKTPLMLPSQMVV